MRYTQLLGIIARLDLSLLNYDEIGELNQLMDDKTVCPKNEDNPFEHDYIDRISYIGECEVCQYCGDVM